MDGPAPTWRPRIGPDVDWVEIEGRIVAIDAHDGLHVLAGAGVVVWPLLDGSVSLAELADDVAAVFAQDRATVLDDLWSFASDAAAAGLVAVPDGEGGR